MDTQQHSTTTPFSDALRVAAVIVDAHPHLPAPYVTGSIWGVDLQWHLFAVGDDDEDESVDYAAQKADAQRIIRTLGGTWDKVPGQNLFAFTQRRGDVTLKVNVDRPAVCTRVVKGVEQVTVPAVEAQPERTEDREIVEWVCEPVLTEAVPA